MKNAIPSNHNTEPQSFTHNNHSDAKRSLTGNTFLLWEHGLNKNYSEVLSQCLTLFGRAYILET